MMFKNRFARRLTRSTGILFLAILLPVVLFLGAAGVTAFIPRNGVAANSFAKSLLPQNGQVTIYLVTSPLHADIALPFSLDLLGEFPEFSKTVLPLENPQLKYLGFGWGSKAFYTTAGEYSDIRFSTAFTAITGDVAVMRVVGLPELMPEENVFPLVLEAWQYRLLIENIKSGFARDNTSSIQYLPGFTIGFGDAFFEGEGGFNIFHPCNQWVGDVLAKSGINTGIWTPTTYSLLWSLDWNGEIKR